MTMTLSSGFYNEARHTRRLIFSLLRGLSFDSVLDVGCGTGVLLQQILEQHPHTQLTGSEYSAQGIEFARARLPNARFCSIDLDVRTWAGSSIWSLALMCWSMWTMTTPHCRICWR